MVDLFHQSSKQEQRSKTAIPSVGYISYVKAVSTLLATDVLNLKAVGTEITH